MDQVEKAFSEIDRAQFLPDNVREYSYADRPLSIGFGQTNSQPYTVRNMLTWLDVMPGQKILDVGSGSGWTTALLSKLVGDDGKIYAVEIVPKLVSFGALNCKKIGINNANFYLAGNELGLRKHAPYDRILVSASAEKLPVELLQQLKPGGKIIIPVNQDILEIRKTESGLLESIVHPGYMFVPLLNND